MLLVKNNASLWSFYLRQLHPQQQPKCVQRVGTKVVKPFGAITLLQSWVQPAGQVWQPKLTAAQLNCGWAPFFVQHGEISMLLPAGFPVGLYLQGRTNVRGSLKICLAAWICDRVSRTVTKIQHPNPFCHPRNGLMARTTLGCVATDPQGQWMGAKTQQISIIWRVGEYSEASTMYIHPSLPLFHPHLQCRAAVGVQRQMFLSINLLNKDY